MNYSFKLLTQEGKEIEKKESGVSVDEALEGILEKCLLDEPGIFFEMTEELVGTVPEDVQLYVVGSYGVYVKSVEVE